MRESEIQAYIFNNPECLFPGKDVQEKSKEYYIQGKRIDLLFLVGGIRYIIEIKAVPITREHIGQVIEYYGLMREYMNERNLKMILVAPQFPSGRNNFLEELGIGCISLSDLGLNEDSAMPGRERSEIANIIGKISNDDAVAGPILKSDLNGIVSRDKVKKVRAISRDLFFIKGLDKIFKEYSYIRYFGITKNYSSDFDVVMQSARIVYKRGDIWFGFCFGFSGDIKKNDLPNISIIFYDGYCDVTIDAETLKSEAVFIGKIKNNTSRFNSLINQIGVGYKSYVKINHRPKGFYWLLEDDLPPKSFSGEKILSSYYKRQGLYLINREKYIREIVCPHVKDDNFAWNNNKSFNLAMRLVVSIPQSDSIWSFNYRDQLNKLYSILISLKPLVDFFNR